MYCSRCGNKVEDGRTECPYCGSSLVQAPAGVPVQSEGMANQAAGAPVQPGATANQAATAPGQPYAAPETVAAAGAAPAQNGMAYSAQPQMPLPQSRQELKEYLIELGKAESDPALASGMNHLVKSDFSTTAVLRYFGAGWISKQLYPFLQPGERVLALFHIQNRISLRGVRAFLTVTDRRIFRVDKYYILMKSRIKGVSLSQITSIGAEPAKNWFYSVFIGEKVQICAADGTLKLRMVGSGKAQKLKQALTEYLANIPAAVPYHGAVQGVNPGVNYTNPAYTTPAYANPAYTNSAYPNAAGTSKTKKSKKGLIIGLAAGVLVIGGAAAYVVSSEISNESRIEEIKGGQYSWSDITVGTAFDDFFENCSWEAQKTRLKGLALVRVSGRCYYQEADTRRDFCSVTVQFWSDVDSREFGVDTITVNGQLLDDDETDSFMQDVFINRGQIAAGHYISYKAELPDDSALASSEPETQEAAVPETSSVYAPITEIEQDTAPAGNDFYSADPVVNEWEQELAYIQDMSGIDRSQYVLEWSSVSYVDYGQLDGMSYDIARLAVNEIYARHGRMFKDEHLQAYFDSKPWYYGSIAPDQFDEGALSELEKGNIQTIRQYMEEVKGQ